MVKTLDVSTGDIAIDANGNLALANSIEGLRQKVIQKLLFFQGEWFLDVQDGIPYLQDILTRPVDAGMVASIFNSAILEEVEVTGLGNVSSSLNPNTRRFSYNAIVNTIFGDMEINV